MLSGTGKSSQVPLAIDVAMTSRAVDVSEAIDVGEIDGEMDGEGNGSVDIAPGQRLFMI